MTIAEKLQLEEARKAKIIAEFQDMDDCITELNPSETELFKHIKREEEVLGDDEENANNLNS